MKLDFNCMSLEILPPQHEFVCRDTLMLEVCTDAAHYVCCNISMK